MQIGKTLSIVAKPLSIAVLAIATSVTGLSVAAHAATSSGPKSFPRTDAVTVPAHMLSPQQLSHFSHLLHQQQHNSVANQTSTNWSGYAADGTTFSTVSSSWVEPSVSCNSRGIVAFWIGLDGFNSPTVEQDGTGVDCSSGSPQQFAWWETFPANSIQEYPDPVRAGDSLSSTITAQGGGRYNYSLTDSSEGWTEQQVVSANGTNASAEIIAEAVTSGSSVTPLPNFGSISFTGSSFNNNSLQATGASAIDMINSSNQVIASTGPLNGGSFTVAFGSTPPGGGGGGNTVTVNSPGNQTSAVGANANLQISASDSGGASLTYSATGLPAGASINSRTGLITGTLSTAGTSNVTVTATDSTGASGHTSFTWTVGSNSPPPPGCNGVAAWSATTSYIPGNVVSFNGDKWNATWYSTGAIPNAATSWDVWQDEGAC